MAMKSVWIAPLIAQYVEDRPGTNSANAVVVVFGTLFEGSPDDGSVVSISFSDFPCVTCRFGDP